MGHIHLEMSAENRNKKVNELLKKRAAFMKYKNKEFEKYLKLAKEDRIKQNDEINKILLQTNDDIRLIERQIMGLAQCDVIFSPGSLAVTFYNSSVSETFKNYKITRVQMIDKIERMLKKSKKAEIKKILNLII